MLNVTDTRTLDRYVEAVINRAIHHAKNVKAVVPALRGFVETYGNGKIDLYGDGTTNVSWFRSKRTGRRYAFSYNHDKAAIELRANNVRGPVVARFENVTPNPMIDTVFAGL